MKKSFAKRFAAGALALGLIFCAAAVPAAAAGCADPGVVYSQQSPCIFYRLPLNVSGAKVSDKKTRNVTGIVDAQGRAVIATLSTDGHFYVIPTESGYLYIGTGR